MKSCPVELREQIVRKLAEGVSETELVLECGVSPPTIWKWRRQWEEKGNVAPQPRASRQRIIEHSDEDTLLWQLLAPPDGSLTEQCDEGFARQEP